MGDGYLVKFVDDEGNERTVYANARNEREAEQIARSKARNSYTHKYAFESFDSDSTRVSSVYRKNDDYGEDIHCGMSEDDWIDFNSGR